MANASEIYSRMTEVQRRTVIGYVIDQGRHLESLDEWTMEDNFQTTEDLVVAYRSMILPNEDPNTRCDCGNTRHHDDGLSHCTECGDTYTIGTGGDGKCADCLEPGGWEEPTDGEPVFIVKHEDPDGNEHGPFLMSPLYDPRPVTRKDAQGWLVGTMVQVGLRPLEDWDEITRLRDEADATGASEWQGHRFIMTQTEGN